MKTVSVIGLGYIGLPTAVLIANAGYRVKGVDVSSSVLDQLKLGRPHFEESGLATILKSTLDDGSFTVDSKVEAADIFIICVPTPFETTENSKIPDLNYVREAVVSISKVVKSNDIVILESTSPPGTTRRIKEWLANEGVALLISGSHIA